jgi:hypothetical protein
VKFRGHVTVGILTYFIAVIPIAAWILYRQDWAVTELWRRWWELLICFFLCLLGAMVPDTDIRSKSQQVIYSILLAADLILILMGYYRGAAILGFWAIIPNILPHRGPLHSYLAAIIIPAPLLFLPVIATGRLEYQQLGVSYYIATVSGYMSHLLADIRIMDKR